LQSDYNDLSKVKEEQDERLDVIRNKKSELEGTYSQYENDL